ncbi:uncharacterized protein LOC131616634 [Vicia villosa]|uniref:uncharacterized protein LOC131616634 n=1 Tax=Vicia villosa TaxID=3911 RepID=UPI00273AAF64|nr:uncharacterized protein LOC131616634 [Vicia villosa]XP_058743996.1 uncharacterized protein LOC131616634 [Vicia villosa]
MGSNSLKDYLKRYESNPEEDKKKKKRKRKNQPQATGLLVVDEDPAWQKPVDLVEENDENLSDGEKPIVDEDIEVKRMKRLEQLKARRAYHDISEDGSGWIPLSSKSENLSDSNRMDADLSPSRQQLKRNDTPSPERDSERELSEGPSPDLSPPRKQRDSDMSPPRRKHVSNPSPDISPPRKQRDNDMSPPRRKHVSNPSPDISPPRRSSRQTFENNGRRKYDTSDLEDLSPPRRVRHDSPSQDTLHGSVSSDLSPPRKRQPSGARSNLSDVSHRGSHPSFDRDLSPPRKNAKELSVPGSVNERKTGLISGKDIRKEIDRKKKDDLLRLKQMDPVISGRGAEPVFRDNKGVRITKEEYLKSKQKVEEKPKEIEIEWGKGLAQKREAEAKQKELEVEKEKPFARTRDDPELDKSLKERIRWGDPMAHLVKKKYPEPVLPNLGDSDKMRASGFVVPQDIPDHSWLKRGLDAAPNRYGIRPGRHWDGVDRSNGFEKGMFKRTNERQAKDKEAYLWSVSDM